MDDAEAAVLREVEQIIDNEHATHEATETLMELFHLPRRQASISLRQIRGNFHHVARSLGMTFDDYVDSLTVDRKMAIFGFCVGAVCQRDLERHLNPEDGTDTREHPDYQI